MGNQFLLVAVPILVLHVTGSAGTAALSAAAQNLPYLLGPVIGPCVDRMSPKRLFITSEVTSAVLVTGLPFAAGRGTIGLILMYALVFGVGTASVFSSLTNEFTFIPSLLGEGEDRTQLAYSRYNSTLDLARFVGPAAAGAVIAAFGASTALWIDAATFLGTVAVACGLPNRGYVESSESLLSSIRFGWQTFRTVPRLRSLTVVLTLYNLGVGSIVVYLVSVASGPWGWSSVLVGFVVSLGSLVSAVGAWSGRIMLRRTHVLRRIHFWLGASAASALLMPVGWHWLVATGFIAMSFCAGAFNVETLTWRRAVIPRDCSGRVNAIVRCFVAGAIPVSAVLLSLVANGSTLVQFLPVTVAAVAALVVWTAILRNSSEMKQVS
jgi:predicted MFS family arabinose efflux permease